MGKKRSPIKTSLDDLRDAPREELLDTIEKLLAENARLAKQIEQLEAKANKNSSNSSKPSSSDNPYKNKEGKPSKGKGGDRGNSSKGKKPGGQPGHQGHRQKFLKPTLTKAGHSQPKNKFHWVCSLVNRQP